MFIHSSKNGLVKSKDEIRLIEIAAKLVAETLSMLKNYMVDGIETEMLDSIAEDYLKTRNALPAFKGYRVGAQKYPSSLCVSINDEVVHGIPGKRRLFKGDLVSLDFGAVFKGYYADSAVTYGVGNISTEKQRLMQVAEQALNLGIEAAIAGNEVYHISGAVQKHVESNGMNVTRELVGHGIGKNLHEHPPIPNFVPSIFSRYKFPNEKLRSGMAIAIEPMVHLGGKETRIKDDGWTVVTMDRKPAAHFEHTIVIDNKKAIVLTTRD